MTLFTLNPSKKDPTSSLFVRFFDRVSSLNESKTIVKFRLHMHSDMRKSPQTLSEINGLIQKVFLRNVVEFDYEMFSSFSDIDIYLEIPHSESLKVLKVRIDTDYSLKMAAFPGCFPSLRVFDAKLYLYNDGDDLITDLFSCLPASLEKLCLDGNLSECMGKFTLNIGGAALKHLELQLYNKLYISFYDEVDCVVVIDAPKLEYLSLQDTFMASYLVEHKPAINEVRLHLEQDDLDLDGVDLPRIARFSELLQGLVNAKFISVSASTHKNIISQDWNIPLLPSLTKLELHVPSSQRGWIWLLKWLESCPNLKVLSLIIMEEEEFVEENDEVVADVVPSCLSSCVKEIKIKRVGKVDHEKMLIYLLYNAKVLDEFTVDSRVYIKDGIVQ